MVQKHDSTAYVSARRVIVARHERSYSGVGPYDSGICQFRYQLAAFAKEKLHLFLRSAHIVALLERHLVRSGSYHADHIARHENIRIRRLAATVYDHTSHSVIEYQQSTLRRKHSYLHPGQFGDVRAPDAGSVHHIVRVNVLRLPRGLVQDLDALYGSTVHNKGCHLAASHHLGPVKTGVEDIGRNQPEWVHRRVRNPHRSYQRRVDRRLQGQCLLRAEHFRANAGLLALGDKIGLIVKPVLRKRNEQSVGRVHAISGYSANDHILLYALRGGFRVIDRVTRSTVKKSVISP